MPDTPRPWQDAAPETGAAQPVGPRARSDVLLARMSRPPDGDPRRRRLRARVIELNLPYAHRLAARFAHCGEPTDDLNQVAALGLTLAVDRYDPRHGAEFRAYAMPTILGELRRYLRNSGWFVHVPRSLQELARQVREAEAEVTTRLQHTPTPADLAAALHISEQRALAGLRVNESHTYRPVSLDKPISEDPPGPTLLDLLGTPDPALRQAEAQVTARALLARLPERERRILTMRYYRGMSQRSIAGRVGVSQVHVSRLIEQSLNRLRVDALGG